MQKSSSFIQPSFNFISRTYKEFCELYSKLNRAFPKVGLHSLEKRLHLGRQEVQEVAERRKHDIAHFLDVLFQVGLARKSF